MPGIHVRSLGKLDWVERGNEPVLTVPGAYWLCHKKNIYKFTFKWHKTLRNTEGFAYPKELTKVIRRIIKSQPRQGQLFGTRHLLVTYNHSAWMRQDKIFAMLKFQDCNEATAFPHAFVLTVKTLDDSTSEEIRPTRNDRDRSLTVLEDSKTHRTTRQDSEKNPKTTEEISNDLKINDETNDRRSKDDIEIFARVPNSQGHEKSVRSGPSPSSRPDDNSQKETSKRSFKRSRSTDKIERSPISKKRSKRSKILNENEKSTITTTDKDATGDLADLPYQYIIEKEIENSKNISKSTIKETNVQNTKTISRSPKFGVSDSSRSADITDLVMEGLMFTIRQDKDSVTVVEQKTKLEVDEVLENSVKSETKKGEKCLLNTSLLRLENLIGKIEKASAKAKSNDITENPLGFFGNGNFDDSTFWNPTSMGSSFFQSMFDDKNFYAKSSNKKNVTTSLVHSETKLPLESNESSSLITPENKIVDGSTTKPSSIDLQSKELKKIEETKEIGMMNVDCEESKRTSGITDVVDEEEDEVGLELKYDDDKDDEEIGIEFDDGIMDGLEISDKNEDVNIEDFNSTNDSRDSNDRDPSYTPIKDCIETMRAKTPRIVSNEIVTDDQIPPELQKALRRTRRLFSHGIPMDGNDCGIVVDVKSADEELAEEKSVGEKSSDEKSLEEESSNEKSLEEESLRKKSLDEKSLEEKSSEEKLSEEKSSEEKFSEEKSSNKNLLKEISSEKKLLGEKSLKEKCSNEKSLKEKSSDVKSPDVKSLDVKSSDLKSPKDKWSKEESSKEKSSKEKSSEEKLSRKKLAEEKSSKEKSLDVKSSEEKSSKEKSLGEKSSKEKSLSEKSSKEKSLSEKSSKEKSVSEKSSKEKSLSEKSSKEKSLSEKSSKEKSSKEKSSKEKSSTEKSLKEKSSVLKSTVEKSTKSQSVHAPAIDEAATDENVEIDITEEFERELSNGKSRRRRPTRRKSLRNVERSTGDGNETPAQPEIHIEMWKFIQDITHGAKVVIHRLDLANIKNCIIDDSSIDECNSNRRYVDQS